MAENSVAWLMISSGNKQFAVAEHEMIEYITSPVLHNIPLSPRYNTSIMFWREQILPVFNLGLLPGQVVDAPGNRLSVLAYQTRPREPLKYIGVTLCEAPSRIQVNDNQICELPEQDMNLWQHLTLSCFSHDGIATPILDITFLCSSEFRDLVLEYQSSNEVVSPEVMQAVTTVQM